MQLLTFLDQGHFKWGVKRDYGIIDMNAALSSIPAATHVPTGVHELIEGGAEAIVSLLGYIEDKLERELARTSWKSDYVRDEEALQFGPCVPHPGKIVCVGLNYRKHAEETGAAIPQYPVLFNKFPNTLAGHGEEIPLPKVSAQVDYEAELAIVIGRTAKYVTAEQAPDYIFGYCCANDLSARDLQVKTPQWMLGKTCDKFAPLGPYLVTADETGDPNRLAIASFVNDEPRQHSNTSDMIFSCYEIVSYISQHMTLEPGDVILTGTPEGVVLGMPPDKQVYLKAGDKVTIRIEKLGALTNRMAEE